MLLILQKLVKPSCCKQVLLNKNNNDHEITFQISKPIIKIKDLKQIRSRYYDNKTNTIPKILLHKNQLKQLRQKQLKQQKASWLKQQYAKPLKKSRKVKQQCAKLVKQLEQKQPNICELSGGKNKITKQNRLNSRKKLQLTCIQNTSKLKIQGKTQKSKLSLLDQKPHKIKIIFSQSKQHQKLQSKGQVFLNENPQKNSYLTQNHNFLKYQTLQNQQSKEQNLELIDTRQSKELSLSFLSEKDKVNSLSLENFPIKIIKSTKDNSILDLLYEENQLHPLIQQLRYFHHHFQLLKDEQNFLLAYKQQRQIYLQNEFKRLLCKKQALIKNSQKIVNSLSQIKQIKKIFN